MQFCIPFATSFLIQFQVHEWKWNSKRHSKFNTKCRTTVRHRPPNAPYPKLLWKISHCPTCFVLDSSLWREKIGQAALLPYFLPLSSSPEARVCGCQHTCLCAELMASVAQGATHAKGVLSLTQSGHMCACVSSMPAAEAPARRH